MNKKFFIISFLTLGITSIISQVVIIRELMISFYGNELFIGLILFGWLILVALGAWVAAKIKWEKLYLLTLFLTPLLLLGEIILIRAARIFISPFGQTPDLISSLLYLLVAILPLCITLGMQFSLGNKFWLKLKRFNVGYRGTVTTNSDITKPGVLGNNPELVEGFNQSITSQLVNKAYLSENIGFIIGGLLFSFLLIWLEEFFIVLIITLINYFILLWLLFQQKNKFKFLLLICLILLILVLGYYATDLNNISSSWRFPQQSLKISKNSIYGNIAVARRGAQYNFYENGLFLGNNSENLADEVLVHFPLLFSDQPEEVLLIGNGFQDALTEILKHPVKQVYYLETDPALIKTTFNFLSKKTQQSLNSDKVKIINQDGLFFLKQTEKKFDVIITNLSSPATLALNRYYTKEFFQEVNNHLKTNGIFLTWLKSSPNYFNEANLYLQNSIYKTLKVIFPTVIIMPEDNIYYLAGKNLNYQSLPLIERYLARKLFTKNVIPPYIDYRLTNDRVAQTLALFTKTETKINQNLFPNSYFYQNIYWLGEFHPQVADWLLNLSKIKITNWLIFFLIILIIIFLVLRKKKNVLPLTAAIPDFTLFTLEIILILVFQTFYGFVYSQMALIITLLITGMTIGNLLGLRLLKKLTVRQKHLKYIYLGMAVICLCLPLIFNWLNHTTITLGIYLIFPIIFLLPGILNGLEFPLTNHLYLATKPTKISTIYSADQIGAALGALLATFILLPILGVNNTLIFLAVINLFGMLILIRRND